MKAILKDIQDGTFANDFLNDLKAETRNIDKYREDTKKLQIEEVGGRLRSMMKWISK